MTATRRGVRKGSRSTRSFSTAMTQLGGAFRYSLKALRRCWSGFGGSKYLLKRHDWSPRDCSFMFMFNPLLGPMKPTGVIRCLFQVATSKCVANCQPLGEPQRVRGTKLSSLGEGRKGLTNEDLILVYFGKFPYFRIKKQYGCVYLNIGPPKPHHSVSLKGFM